MKKYIEVHAKKNFLGLQETMAELYMRAERENEDYECCQAFFSDVDSIISTGGCYAFVLMQLK